MLIGLYRRPRPESDLRERGKIENCADTVARISGDSNALIHARFLVFQQRAAQAEPDRTRAPEEEATRDSRVHQIGIPNMEAATTAVDRVATFADQHRTKRRTRRR
jgi:hypothetical protein